MIGRTYTADHDGHAMELGGTWVHPEQPHVGAEISRNGMETETFPVLWAVARTCGGDANDTFLGQRSFALTTSPLMSMLSWSAPVSPA